MPRDKDGRWVPEPHKAADYTPEQINAGSRIATDFDKAASPEARDAQITKSEPVMAATTVQSILTPHGHTRLVRNAQAATRQQDAIKMAEQVKGDAARDEYLARLSKRLTKEFGKAQNKDKSKDNDLER